MANYTIQAGDTLSSIAARNGLSWQQLYEANKSSISNPNLIYTGQSITIPGAGSSSGGTGAKVPSPDLYTVNFSGADLSPEHIAQLEDQAYKELAPYYERILSEAKGDVELAKKRLQEDYDRGVRLKTEDVATAIKYATEDTTLNKGELSDKLKYAKDTLQYLDNTQFPLARAVLDQTYNRRGLFNSGLRTVGQENLGKEQALTREGQVLSIKGTENDITRQDTALTRTTDQQNLELLRQKEAGGITLTRAEEDAKIQLERKQQELEQRRRQEAIGIASSKLSREAANNQIGLNYGGA